MTDIIASLKRMAMDCAEAQDDGTSEGAKNGWEKRKHSGTGIEIQNADHERMFKLYDKDGERLLDKSPRSEYETSSPRVMFEDAYRATHGKPIREDWQDHLDEVLKEKTPDDIPSVEQIDDFVDKHGMHTTAAERYKDGVNRHDSTVLASYMGSLFPHYRDKSLHATQSGYGLGYGQLGDAKRRKFVDDLRKTGFSKPIDRTHPVMKFLDKAYPVEDCSVAEDYGTPEGARKAAETRKRGGSNSGLESGPVNVIEDWSKDIPKKIMSVNYKKAKDPKTGELKILPHYLCRYGDGTQELRPCHEIEASNHAGLKSALASFKRKRELKALLAKEYAKG